MSRPAAIGNWLLRALPPEEFALLAPHLRRVSLPLHAVLVGPDEAVTACCFVESGFASLACLHRQARVEVDLVGPEGLVGAAPVLLGDARLPQVCTVRMPGEGWVIGAQELRSAVARCPSLQARLLAYLHTRMLQLGETAYAHAALNLEARLARWLLMCHDRLGIDELPLTHAFFSTLLTTRRAGVTLALQALEGARLIRGRRKRILILDRTGLAALTQGSYGVAEAAYARLIGEPQASARGVAFSSAQSNSSSSL